MYFKIFFAFLIFCSISFSTSKEVIREKIEKVLNRLPPSTKMGIIIFNPLTQDTIIYRNHTESMIPASNTKLFTTAAALSLMGGDFFLSTQLLTDDYDLTDGVINGNLYLKGLGNSVFSEHDLENMVKELTENKLYSVTGNVIGDDTFFDDVYTRDDWIKDEKANVKLPPISAIVINRNRKITPIKRGRRIRNYVISIADPPQYAATLLKEKLNESGINVYGKDVKGVTPPGANLITESKISLREIIALINKSSDNFLAECLFKEIGAVASGSQGNSFYSTQAVLNFIDENAIFSKGTAVVDGSGISRFNQITAGAIAGLLEKMYFDLINFEDFYNSLSIAGVDGTLRNRLAGTAGENNFRGKTGTLNGVSSLSGYLTTLSNEDLIVSIISEYSRGGSNLHKDIEDEIIKILSEWN